MYEQEIGDALDRGDLEAVWLYMAKRTAWLQHAELDPEQLLALQASTQLIKQRLQSVMADLQTRLGVTRRHVQYARVYEGGAGHDGSSSRQKV